ncbi:MAG: exosome 3'-_5 exonuclease subunit ski4 (Csl4) [Caeruleum heppii]|nr:MAG: exosome 3'->5 exonuclease subunit ski4 (Csl4) [Caeruleum heppii]
MTLPSIAIPGRLLGPVSQYVPGPGTYVRDGGVCASVSGIVTAQSPEEDSQRAGLNSAASRKTLPTLSVSRAIAAADEEEEEENGERNVGLGTHTVLPEVDAVVLARVTRITTKQANVAILVVGEGGGVCRDEFGGVIRAQDVRATEKDTVKIAASFRPGDIVRAQVISLGDQQSYYLATASNHLGVIMATSEAGNQMYPLSWKEFRDPVTGKVEERKVAKPF